ncbi:carboxypeptidase-like regulatory domain-containing protein [Pedobacter panaciterrae]
MKSKFLLFSLLITFLLSIEGYAQTGIKVSGKVSDAKGEGIPGVSVKVKGGKVGALTDGSGNYALTAPDAQSILQFSFIGFDSQEFTVGSKTQINVTLKETQNELEQVVVVGYGTSKKKDLTGAISSISKESLNLGVLLQTLHKPFRVVLRVYRLLKLVQHREVQVLSASGVVIQ